MVKFDANARRHISARSSLSEKQLCESNKPIEVSEAKYGLALEEESRQADAEEVARHRTHLQEKQKYSAELDKQLREQAQKRMRAYEEFLREKMAIDEVVRRIHEEDQQQAEQRLQRKRAYAAEMEAFKMQQLRWRLAEKERIRQENERIVKEIAEQESREDISARNRLERQKNLEEIQAKLRKFIECKEAERTEVEMLRQELSQEEAAYAAMKTDEVDVEQKLRLRLELQNAHQQALAQRARRLAAEREEEELYRTQMLAQMAERDRLEQLSDEKRRLKLMEHRRDLQVMLEKKRQEVEKQRQEEEDAQAAILRREEVRRLIIEEERIRLLKEHAKPLLGYLPKGILKNDTELQEMDPEVQSVILQSRNLRMDDATSCPLVN
uniref:Meiosis-specific nuclear structural protein 1 n=1 Tax=Mesocestoides corti TaxID=53468 RepID=A0A5K3EHL2_MESCO